jgi:hypothetical protein
MKKKLNLELEALAVDSFETSAAANGNGTVHAHDATTVCHPTPPEYEGDCTCVDSCLCPTNAYYCATVHATVISCDYTYNGSCGYDTKGTCSAVSIDIC